MLENKANIVAKYGKNPKDTGSVEVQVAILSDRIQHLTEHFKSHNNDNHGRRGLMHLVGKRRRLLEYLKSSDVVRYTNAINALNLRK